MVARPTRTTNRIHFTDLDPARFEDLCLTLVFPLHPWVDIRHYGRVGSDGGVDILAKERIEDGTERDWFIQCRRYASAAKAILEQAVDDVLEKAAVLPHVLLVVVACDVSRQAHEAYTRYAFSKGISTPLLWTASFLEAYLYSQRRDLLFSYFGISTAADARYREATITRNISLKKRLRSELLKSSKSVNLEEVRRRPSEEPR